MNNELLMKIFQAFCDLFDYLCCLFLWHFFLLFDLLQTSVRQKFHYQIEILFIVEKSIERSDVLVAEIGLEFDFSDNMFFHFGLPNAFFGHLL